MREFQRVRAPGDVRVGMEENALNPKGGKGVIKHVL